MENIITKIISVINAHSDFRTFYNSLTEEMYWKAIRYIETHTHTLNEYVIYNNIYNTKYLISNNILK